jgi:hypothetical protein
MTDEERALTLAAIDAAYAAQIGKLFAVLCSATDDEFEGFEAADRFTLGLRRAMEARGLALDANIDVAEAREHPEGLA